MWCVLVAKIVDKPQAVSPFSSNGIYLTRHVDILQDRGNRGVLVQPTTDRSLAGFLNGHQQPREWHGSGASPSATRMLRKRHSGRSADYFFNVIVIRHETTATARWALLLTVRTLFNDAITIAVWTGFHVCLPVGHSASIDVCSRDSATISGVETN
jgi:hypothetical protein